MSYNRRGLEPNRPANSAAHYYQRTIPEMLALRQENSVGGRHNKSVRFLEHSSELAVAPASPVVPPSNNPYYPSMGCVPYEAQSARQFSQYHQQGTPMYQETPQRHPSASYYDQQPHVTPQMPRYQPQTPVHQPYYGVPGFYTPNYGSSYDESATAMNNHQTVVCDNAYSASRPQPRRALGAFPSASSSENAAPRPLPSSTPARKRAALETAVKEPSSDAMGTPNKQARFIMESNSDKESKTRAPRAPALHIFSGPVQRILKWEPAREHFPMLFEVVAPLKSVKALRTHQELLLRDEAGPVLQVLFYEIDRAMPKLQPGQLVRVVGRMISRARLQAFSVRPASEVERCSMQRMSFVCHRAATQMLAPSTT